MELVLPCDLHGCHPTCALIFNEVRGVSLEEWVEYKKLKIWLFRLLVEVLRFLLEVNFYIKTYLLNGHILMRNFSFLLNTSVFMPGLVLCGRPQNEYSVQNICPFRTSILDKKTEEI